MKKGSGKSQFINECSLCYRQQVGWLSEKCFDWLISSLTDWLVDWKVLSLCEQLTDKRFVWHMTVCTWPTCVCNTQLQLWPAFAYSWLQNGPGTRYVPSPLLIFYLLVSRFDTPSCNQYHCSVFADVFQNIPALFLCSLVMWLSGKHISFFCFLFLLVHIYFGLMPLTLSEYIFIWMLKSGSDHHAFYI